MKMLLKAQSEQNLLLRNLLAIDETANEANSEFPIKTESDLQDFEKRINPETRSSYVSFLPFTSILTSLLLQFFVAGKDN